MPKVSLDDVDELIEDDYSTLNDEYDSDIIDSVVEKQRPLTSRDKKLNTRQRMKSIKKGTLFS